MASLSDILAIVKQIHDELPDLIARAKLTPKQVVISSGLSDISEKLGLVQAGEFRVGNSKEAGDGFTGVRIGYPAFSYNSLLWNIAGLSADVLQFGANSADGTLWAGGGSVRLTSGGILVYNGSTQTGAIESDGDIKFGSNIAAAGTTSFIVFANAQTYNGEAVGAGDVLIGDNSTGKPNILWDASASELLFRLGTIVTNRMSSSSVAASACRLWRSTTQTIPTVTNTYVQFDTEVFDDDSYANLGSDNTKITISRSGLYLVGLGTAWNSVSVGPGYSRVELNGPAGQSVVSFDRQVTASFPVETNTNLVQLAANDTLKLQVYHNSGGDRDIVASAAGNVWSSMWLIRQR